MTRKEIPLPPPKTLQKRVAITKQEREQIASYRQEFTRLLQGGDNRLVMIVGPCSIHHTTAALDYARKLKSLSKLVSDQIFLLMRVYCEKPRTSLGWKGLLHDPYLDNSGQVEEGLIKTREVMRAILREGVPVATEFLNPITCHYYHDLVTWGSIGARTSASAIHRELASSLHLPIGFKNATDGDISCAIHGMVAARCPQYHVTIDERGRAVVSKTTGNLDTHLILRGSDSKSNYDETSMQLAISLLEKHRLNTRLMIDCSHGNSRKQAENQKFVFGTLLKGFLQESKHLLGVMLESNLTEGKQSHSFEAQEILPDVSLTDDCLGWDETEHLILQAHAALQETKLAHIS